MDATKKLLRVTPYLIVDRATFERGVNEENQVQTPSQSVGTPSEPTSQPPSQKMPTPPQLTTSTYTTDDDLEAQPQPDTAKSQQRLQKRRCNVGKHKLCFILSSIIIGMFICIFGFAVWGLVFEGEGISAD